jgi:hypothetical protein
LRVWDFSLFCCLDEHWEIRIQLIFVNILIKLIRWSFNNRAERNSVSFVRIMKMIRKMKSQLFIASFPVGIEWTYNGSLRNLMFYCCRWNTVCNTPMNVLQKCGAG